jgi:DNA-binding response OmpR family regulator
VPNRVLDIGNCDPDHAAITELVTSNFDAVVDQADRGADAVALLKHNKYALAVVNRLLDCDGSSGMDVVRNLKNNHPNLPVILITNFEEHQQTAIEIGAEVGFGKNGLRDAGTVDLLAKYLG